MTQHRFQQIAVAGAGAIGALFGARLALAGHDVTLIDGWRDHVKTIASEGLLLSDPLQERRIRIKALHFDRISRMTGTPRILLLAVKSYDTQQAVKAMSSRIASDTCIMSCQNGINEGVIAGLSGRQDVVGCVISLSARLEGPGHVRQLREGGHLALGQWDGGLQTARWLAPIMSAVAPARATGNLMGHRWAKLALNCIGNPLLAVSGYTARQLHRDPAAQEVMVAVVDELVRTAEAGGIAVEPIAGMPAASWKQAARKPSPSMAGALVAHGDRLGDARSSMSYDFKVGKPTEIDFLNGYVVRTAEAAGVMAPVNRAVVDVVGKLCRGEIDPDPTHLLTILTLTRS